MKYFKNVRGEGEDSYYVVFNCTRKSASFVNYLKTLGGCKEDQNNYMFHSRVIDIKNVHGWAKSYQSECTGYTHVYGFALPLKIITDFIEIMEDN